MSAGHHPRPGNGHCADHDGRIAGATRVAAVARPTEGWSAADRTAFAPLQKAHAAFVEAHGSGETDLSGTARAALGIGAEEKARTEFLDILQRPSSGRVPYVTAEQCR